MDNFHILKDRRAVHAIFPLFAALLLAAVVADPPLRAANGPPESASAIEADNPEDTAAKEEQQKKIAALIGQLGDKDYFVRQKAQDDLSRMGFEAYEAISAASTNDDLEIASRAKYLLKLMRIEWSDANDPPEVKRLLKGYELLDEEARADRIHSLAVLADAKAAPALCRLARFEKSNVLSKRAAVELIQTLPDGRIASMLKTIAVRKYLNGGNRTAVRWINACLRLPREPQAALDDFKKLIDAEMILLQQNPGDTNPEVIASLMRYYIAQLKRQNQNEAVVQAMHRLIDLLKDDSTAIADLAEWFLDQKAWDSLDELSKRFESRFKTEPILLYLHAEAKLAQNETTKAEELATRAFRCNQGKENVPLHYIVAHEHLQKRGLFPWAIREYKYLIDRSDDQGYGSIRYVFDLAEILYDQDRNLEAGKTIESFLKRPSTRRLLALGPAADLPMATVRAQMYYYFACHWESQGDAKQQRENIEKAAKESPKDVNALIGFYRLPDLKPEEKQKVVQTIEQVSEELRESIRNNQRSPDNPRETVAASTKEGYDCNQFAWLIANTVGDLDEALKYSKRSVELQPTSGGLYDTLAHVYYAKGDYESAVSTQKKALELEPHSGLIKKKLDVFEKALAEKKK